LVASAKAGRLIHRNYAYAPQSRTHLKASRIVESIVAKQPVFTEVAVLIQADWGDSDPFHLRFS
jgi:hypothetical protein